MAVQRKPEIHAKCTLEEKDAIREKADELGLNMSDLIIWSVLYPERIIAFQEGKLKKNE